MGGKLNLYNLGDIGVDVVASPIHSADGSLVSAQNAQIEEVQGEHTIGKRAGLALLTSTPMSGAVLAIGNIPFPDPYAPLPTEGTRFYVNTQTDGAQYNISTVDGTTWITVSNTPTRWANTVIPVGGIFTAVRGGAISGRDGTLVFVDGTSLCEFNGAEQVTLATVTLGTDERARGICLHDNQPHVLITDIVANTAVIKKWDGTTFASIGAVISHEATCITSALGALWIGTDTNRIYRSTSTGSTTVDLTIVPSAGATMIVTDIEMHDGVLYASCGTTGTAATSNKILTRSSVGIWTDVTPVSAITGNYGPICTFEGSLYALRNADATFTGCQVYARTAGVWAQDVDLDTVSEDTPTVAPAMQVFNDAIYVIISYTNRGIARKANGVWTRVVNKSVTAQDAPVATCGFY